MTNLTLNSWKVTVSIGIVEKLPLQDQQSAFILAEDFLATTGGWVPDDPLDPTGPGVPASGVTTEEAIQIIFDNNLDRIYSIDAQGTATFNITFEDILTEGLSDADVLLAIEAKFRDFVESQFTGTNMEFVQLDSFTGTVLNGPTDAAERVALQSLITGGGKLTNPRAIALSAARARFALNPTFNVTYLYTEENKDLFILLNKYTDTTYQTIDTSFTEQFAVNLNPVSYVVTSGLKFDV